MTRPSEPADRADLTWHELLFPAGLDQPPVLNFLRVLATRTRHGLFGRTDPLVIETIGSARGLRWSLGTSRRETAWTLPQLRSQVPGVRLERLDQRLMPPVELAIELRLNTAGRSLRTDAGEAVASALLTVLRDVHGDELAALTWLIGPWLPRPVVKPQPGQPGGLLARLVQPPRLDREDLAALKAKIR